MSQHPENRLFHEAVGLLLLGLGTLLFLALVSYEARDVPSWFWLARITPANREIQNNIGLVGTLAACTSYFFFGAAAFLVAVTLLGLGAAKLLSPSWPILRRLPWMVGFVASASCFLQIQHHVLRAWPHVMGAPGPGGGPGGLLGYWIGVRLLQALLGNIGSLILLTTIYLSCLILLTGIHPIVLLRNSLARIPVWLKLYRQWRIDRATERERLAQEQQRSELQQRKLEKQSAKKGGKASVTEPAPDPNEPEIAGPPQPEFDPDRPPPQVIDTTAPTPRKPEPAPKKEKLVLAEPVHLEDYVLPTLDLLDEQSNADRVASDPEEMLKVQETVIETLAQFGIAVAPGNITRGPSITRYEVYPAKGVRVDKIVSLERDIARATRAERINILAPIPGKDTVGIEIANSKKQKVAFRELLESDDWVHAKAKIPLVLGKDVYGKVILGDLASMPHLLVAGTTGSGKSVCINSIIASILYRFTPDELRFIMIDPKVVEMQIYNTLPHLVIPVVTDPKKVLLALRWVIDEMEKRYKIFAKAGVRNITSFNARPKPKTQKELDAEIDKNGQLPLPLEPKAKPDAKAAVPPWDSPENPEEIAGEASDAITPEGEEALEEIEEVEEAPKPVRVRRDDEIEIPQGPMSYIVVIIDELADLMQTAPADVESAIARITQMARAAGIHMIVATQTPRADVITGVIKANIPSRIAFQVASGLDSRIILDEKGAERLLGQGDMMYLPPGTSRLTRAQGVLVTDDEIRRVVEFASKQGAPLFSSDIHDKLSGNSDEPEELSEEDEELVQKCIEIMKQEKKASTSLFQRRLRLGYTRAARVVDILEQRGYVAAGEGAKPREILVDLDDLV